MHNFLFTGLTARFYPDERGDDGRSLMALPGDVHAWSHTPDDGLWVLADPPAADPAPAPEPAPEDFQAAPEPAPAPDPVPAPEPVPEPVPAAPEPAMTADWFAGLTNPPARA